MGTKKYELTTDTKIHLGRTLCRIKALVSFGTVSADDTGGYVESENNLSHMGDAWVYDNAWVSGNARVSGGEHTICPASAVRSDGYTFVAYSIGDELRIAAGCHNFAWEQALAHWGDPYHHKHAESMRPINYLKSEVEARI